MIQRIQTVFLFLAGLLLSGQFFVPYYAVESVVPGVPASLSDGILTPNDNLGLLGLTILGGLLSIVAIFLFNNRKFQAQITALSLMVSILLMVLLGFVMLGLPQGLGHFGFGLGLPLLGAVCQFMARRAIRRDENLVRSMDRLR
ncbi:MAG: DUF4293 family protein [Bacteroidetes bacterium]|nr:DUF4293 family protein [Bacteroidota bacterium]